jgi:hypothetical protein
VDGFGLQIRNPGMHPFYIVPYIKHNAGEYVKYERETNSQEGRVNKKQPYFTDGNVKFFAKVGAHPKGVAFKKGKYPLQHIRLISIVCYQCRIAGIF